MNFSSTKSVQTTFVAPQKPSIETFNNQKVIKVIISYENFITNLSYHIFYHNLFFLIFKDKNLASNKNLVGKDYWEHDKYLNIQLTEYFLQYLLYKTCLSDCLNDFLMRSDSWY